MAGVLLMSEVVNHRPLFGVEFVIGLMVGFAAGWLVGFVMGGR